MALLVPGTAAAVPGIDIGFAEPRLNSGKKIPLLREQAAYVSEALYRNWQDKVELAMLYQLGDDESLLFQTGIYFENGKPKPSLTGFSFPLVGDRRSKKKVPVWAGRRRAARSRSRPTRPARADSRRSRRRWSAPVMSSRPSPSSRARASYGPRSARRRA